jgi:hypothetical protein
MFLFLFFFYNNKFVKIFQATIGYFSFMFFKQVFLFIQVKDLGYNFFFLFIKVLFLFFNRFLLVLSRDIPRLFIR